MSTLQLIKSLDARADRLLNKSDDGGGGTSLLAPPEVPQNSQRRTSEGSLPWGTSVSMESGSDEEESNEEMKDSTPVEEGGACGNGNGIGTDGASDANEERRGSMVKEMLEKKKKGEKRRRKPDKHGNSFYITIRSNMQTVRKLYNEK